MKTSSIKNKFSRYVQGGESTVTKRAVAWWERDHSIGKPAEDDLEITSLPAVYDGRPDLLSYDLYGRDDLDWVILQRNNIVDINEEFVTGAKIFAPSKTRMFGAILNKTIRYDEE